MNGAQSLDISSAGWGAAMDPFRPPDSEASGSGFIEHLTQERLASVCSYHEIQTRHDFFHCVWQVENPTASAFFQKPPRRTRSQQQSLAQGVYNDVSITGPVFEGVGDTTWQAIAYPFGYRSHQREALVGKLKEKSSKFQPKKNSKFKKFNEKHKSLRWLIDWLCTIRYSIKTRKNTKYDGMKLKKW